MNRHAPRRLSAKTVGLMLGTATIVAIASPSTAIAGAPARLGVTTIASPTYSLVATIPGSAESRHFAIDLDLDPLARKAYVSTNGGVDVVSLRTNTFTKRLVEDSNYAPVAVDPLAHRAYVVTYPSVQAFNTLTDAPTKSYETELVTAANVAVDSLARTLYWTYPESGLVASLNLRTGVFGQTYPDGIYPQQLATDSLRHRVFVANTYSRYSPDDGSHSLAVLDSRTGAVLKTVLLDSPPTTVAVDLALGKVFVATGATVTVLDAKTYKVIATIASLGGNGADVSAVDQIRHLAYLPNGYEPSVTVINTRTNKVVATIPTPSNARTVDVDPITGRVYVIDDAGTLSVFAKR